MITNRINQSLLVLLTASLGLLGCKKNEPEVCEDDSPQEEPALSVIGFGIMDKLPGIWNGPVDSPTPLGSYPEWIVDFRPISSAQVSAKNELDSLNDIFMSFFVVKHDNAYKMAFRNGGGFAGAERNSYMIIDSLDEAGAESFYRFVDPISGGNRVFTDVTFKDDSLIMHTYTNQYNTLSEPVTHMIWRADLRDNTSAQSAISQFNYPQQEMVRDFSTTFQGLSEAIFYSSSSDPYPQQEQPHLGVSNVTVNVSNPASVDPAKKVLIIITTEPLFDGFVFNPSRLDFRSRYVFVGAESTTGFDFDYMHPGDYYVNAIYDENGDFNFSSGDYMNSSFDIPLTLSSEGTASASVDINFQIP